MGRRTTWMPSGRVGRSAAVRTAVVWPGAVWPAAVWPRAVWPGATWLVGLATAASVLSGCQSDATPPATTSPSASVTSASPSPSVSSPSPSASASVEVPAAARVKSEKGAEAFVRYFFDQVNAAWMRPDPVLLEPLSDPKCQFCNEVEKTSRQLAQDGHRYSDSPVSLSQLKREPGAPVDQVIFKTVITQHAANVVDGSGRVISTDQAGRGESRIGVRWTAGGWRMVGVEVA
jgi:hypothetical protein